MSLEIFGDLPDLPKRLIVKYLLSSSSGIELVGRNLPITWLFSAPDEELDFDGEEDFVTGPCLWIDIRAVENTEVDLRDHTQFSIYSGLLLATHWNLVDTVYLKSISFDGYGGLWEEPRPLVPQINKVNFEQVKPYLNLCASRPLELDPFMIREYRDTIHKLGCKWGDH